MSKYVVAITGASGVIYGVRFVNWMLENGYEVHLIVSEPGLIVMREELGWDIAQLSELPALLSPGMIVVHDNKDIAAKPASGSFRHDGMIIIPCTMSTLSGVAHGTSKNLTERAADVALKEGLPLVVVPRETPLSIVHLRNMLVLAEAGARIIPAMPAFYGKPSSMEELVDFVIGKVLDNINITNNVYNRYLDGK
ncbi:MAG: UbiX family flavin prenyltransferase [Acidobacteriota bacterium]